MLTASSTAPRSTDAAPPDRAPVAAPRMLGAPPALEVEGKADERATTSPEPAALEPAIAEAVRALVVEAFGALKNSLFADLRRRGLVRSEKGEAKPSAAQLEAELQRVRDAHAAELERLRAEHEREKDELIAETARATRDAMSGRKGTR